MDPTASPEHDEETEEWLSEIPSDEEWAKKGSVERYSIQEAQMVLDRIGGKGK